MHSGKGDEPLVFLRSNGQQNEIVCMVKRVLNSYFICFRQEAGWNARFVPFHRSNQSDLSGFQLHGQRNWRVIIVRGNVSVCSRNWQNQIQNSLGWDWQSRCMSASYRVNFWRNRVEGCAISRIYSAYLVCISWNYTFLWIHGEIHQLCNQVLECSLLHKLRQICRICCE